MSLFMTSIYFMSKYDDGNSFKILFFIFIFFLLKLDGKVFLQYFDNYNILFR